ncbi:P-type E1-E2 ATPase [Arthrobacter ulcerisalmonis]|nr:hypothetical protein [Arthrobacter ulcerisalmonis]MDQ0664628.1 P-type E1-E2 ATPase [Arthrobacter ulcerisalmonis]
MTELSTLSSGATLVRRDGEEIVLPDVELVLGNIIVLGACDVLPADCLIIDSTICQVDESSLTGEPLPVEKPSEA